MKIALCMVFLACALLAVADSAASVEERTASRPSTSARRSSATGAVAAEEAAMRIRGFPFRTRFAASPPAMTIAAAPLQVGETS